MNSMEEWVQESGFIRVDKKGHENNSFFAFLLSHFPSALFSSSFGQDERKIIKKGEKKLIKQPPKNNNSSSGLFSLFFSTGYVCAISVGGDEYNEKKNAGGVSR